MAGIVAVSATTDNIGDTAADKDLSGYLTTEQIALSTDPTGISYRWNITKPSGSSRSVLTSRTSASPTFTPDVTGYYVISVTVDDSTTYVARIAVARRSSHFVPALNHLPLADASVTTPRAGTTVYHSEDQDTLSFRKADGTTIRLSTLVAGGSGGVYVTPEDYGAVGDGLTNDAAALQAALDSGEPVFIPPNVYRSTVTLTLNAGQHIAGAGANSVIFCDGNNVDALFATGVDGLTLRDFTVRGNQTGLGGTGGAGGNGVYFDTCGDVSVSGLRFEGIGHPSDPNYASPIGCRTVARIAVLGCTFTNSCRNVTGSDVGLGYDVTDATVSGNISVSECDAFILLLSGTSTAAGDTVGQFTVQNNVVRRTNEACRSAILAPYGALPCPAVIVGNVIEGFIWNGIYLSAAVAPSKTDRSAGVVVSGNRIRHCGGEGLITSGIYVSGTAGASVSGNIVEFTGYKRDGTKRALPGTAPGIKILQYTEGATVTGNRVALGASDGISVSCSTESIDDVAITGNVVLDNEGTGIGFGMNGVDGNSIIVADNVVASPHDTYGIFVNGPSGGRLRNSRISGNSITHTGGASTLDGVYMSDSEHEVDITGNTVDGFRVGMRWLTAGSREIPDVQRVSGNTIRNCSIGYGVSSAFRDVIFCDCTFDNVTTPHADGGQIGRIIGTNASGELIVEITASAAPTAGTWRVGDRVAFKSPSAGGNIGAVCVTAGTPGTWKTYGAISA